MRRVSLAFGFGFFLALACRSDFDKECPAGELTCACTSDGECLGDLVCTSQVCVEAESETSSDSGNEAETSGSEASTSDSEAGTGDGDGDTTGDGDGDTTGDGDGDTTGDGDGDTTGDECATGRSCVPDAPFGWSGPVSLNFDDDLPAGLQACPGDLPVKVDDLVAEFDAGAATCVCTCDDGEGWACAQHMTVRRRSGSCTGASQGSSAVLSTCTPVTFSTGDFIKVEPPVADLSAASCPPISTPDIEDPSFGREAVACEGTGAVCSNVDGAGTCQPADIAGFERFCVYSESATSCPSGPYTELHTLYTGIAGAWACPSCGCESPTGACSGSVEAHENDSCPDGLENINAPDCMEWTSGIAVGAMVAYNLGSGTFSCTPTDPNPSPSASPSPDGARSYCCLP